MKSALFVLLCLLACAGAIYAHQVSVQGKSYEFRTRDGIEIQIMLMQNNELTVRYNGHSLGSRSNFCEALGGDDE